MPGPTRLPADLNSASNTAAGPAQGEGALGSYLRAIRSHKLLILLVTLAAIGASVAWVTLRSPNYEATANVLVTPLPDEDQTFLGLQALRESGSDPTRTVQTAATLIESAQAADRTARALGGDWTAKKVLDAIEVSPEGESNILAVKATADDQALSARLANQFVRQSLRVRDQIITGQADTEIDQLRARISALDDEGSPEAAALAARINQLEAVRRSGDPTLALSQRAAVPDKRAGPPVPVIIALAALAGFTLGSGAALLLELLELRIRDEDEAVTLFPLPVLARVPVLPKRLLRRRTDGQWLMPPPVREAFRTLLAQLGETRQGHVIMVTSGSTGDGKTSSAVNLAVAIAAGGGRAVLLDLDLRKPDVGRVLGMDRTALRMATLLSDGTGPEEMLVPAPNLPGVEVFSMDVREGDVAGVDALHRRLPELIAHARASADYVVIDTAPLGEVSDALRVLGDVDDVLVVVRPGQTNRENFEVMRDLIGRSGKNPKGMLVIGHVAPTTSAYYGYGPSTRELGERRGRLTRVRSR